MERIVRNRYLTKEEADKYNKIREQIEKEFPPMKKSLGSTFNAVSSEKVLSLENPTTVVIKITSSLDEEHLQQSGITISRDAAIRLYHQLNNMLFTH